MTVHCTRRYPGSLGAEIVDCTRSWGLGSAVHQGEADELPWPSPDERKHCLISRLCPDGIPHVALETVRRAGRGGRLWTPTQAGRLACGSGWRASTGRAGVAGMPRAARQWGARGPARSGGGEHRCRQCSPPLAQLRIAVAEATSWTLEGGDHGVVWRHNAPHKGSRHVLCFM